MALTRDEIANEHARRKLARAGFNEQGEPLSPPPEDGGDEVEPEHEDPAAKYEQELQALRDQLSAANGRVGPTQAELEDYRRANADLRARLTEKEASYQQELNRLKAEMERTTPLTPADVLSEEEAADLDPSLLNAVMKLADAVAKKRIPQVDVRSETLKLLQEREHNKVQEYRNRVLTDPTRGLHQLAQLTQDQAFQRWSSEDDNDMEGPVRMLLAADSTEEIDRYQRIIARRIERFKAAQKEQASRHNGSPADASTRLATGMRRNPDKPLTDAETEKKLNEARRLSRSASREDRRKAQAIIDSLS